MSKIIQHFISQVMKKSTSGPDHERMAIQLFTCQEFFHDFLVVQNELSRKILSEIP